MSTYSHIVVSLSVIMYALFIAVAARDTLSTLNKHRHDGDTRAYTLSTLFTLVLVVGVSVAFGVIMAVSQYL